MASAPAAVSEGESEGQTGETASAVAPGSSQRGFEEGWDRGVPAIWTGRRGRKAFFFPWSGADRHPRPSFLMYPLVLLGRSVEKLQICPEIKVAEIPRGSTQWNRKCQDFPGSVRLALEVGSTYIEIYQEDLLIPELAKVAEEVNRELKPQVRQYGRPRVKTLPLRPGSPPGKESRSTK